MREGDMVAVSRSGSHETGWKVGRLARVGRQYIGAVGASYVTFEGEKGEKAVYLKWFEPYYSTPLEKRVRDYIRRELNQ